MTGSDGLSLPLLMHPICRSLFVSPGLVQWATSRFNLCAQLLRWWLFWFYDLVLGWTITTNNRLIMGLVSIA